MKQIIPYIILSALSALCSCASPDADRLTSLQQEAVAQAISLVDSGCIRNKYVVLDEFSANDSNAIYSVADHATPYTPFYEPPFEVIPYKEKFICLTGMRNVAMPISEVNRVARYSGNPLNVPAGGRWLLGVSLGKVKSTLFEGVPPIMFRGTEFLERPQLWPYYSGYDERDTSMLALMVSHDILVSIDERAKKFDSYEIDNSTLRKDVTRLSGEIYFMNNTDSSMILQGGKRRLRTAVLNGRDTLFLHLSDSGEIRLRPRESREMLYVSEPNRAFFRNLSQADPWKQLYDLVKDSSFVFITDELPEKKRMMHNDSYYGFVIVDDNDDKELARFTNGVKDREALIDNVINYFWDK
jgi:hypothetical protein